MGKKAKKGNGGFDGDGYNKNVPRQVTNGTGKFKISFKHQSNLDSQTSLIRKQVEPETAKYFSEIANLFESRGVDVEERSVICGNALEEARGKELELATDYIISHTLQTLLEGCDVDHLCSFLKGCANVFPAIAMDRSGSHVAETALKSLARHVQDTEDYTIIEETLKMICKVIVVNPVDLMCNCYGSHVLRSFLCLCKGVPVDSAEFHGAKASKILAERLNLKVFQSDENNSQHLQQGFPNLLKSLVSGMVKCTREDIKTLQVDQYSSLVLQTALKLLAGNDQELLQIIPVLLGCKMQNLVEGKCIDLGIVRETVDLMNETAFSHLMEVILEVAPESLYNEMFTKLFKNSLFELSSHHCGNFVVQALISHARTKDQMELMWEELGLKFEDLLGMGKSGVIASLIAACQRLQTHEYKCCQALAAAVGSKNESSKCIVPRILFLDSYFSCEDKLTWNWAGGVKIQTMGSLILQAIFKFQSEWIQPFIMSITSMDAVHVLEASKDAGGARVIEAFLASDASTKQKRRLVVKLRGHFGELAMHPSGSFTVERCFNAGSLSLREAIASELLAVQAELSKTKQGPHLLRKLDIDRYATKPDQWRSKQASKQSAYNEFYFAFGSSESKSPTKDKFLSNASLQTSDPEELKNTGKEIDSDVTSTSMLDDTSAEKKNKRKKRNKDAGSEDAVGSKKVMENAVHNFLSQGRPDKKRRLNDRASSNASKQKLKF
ncbi:pumilio homolog 23 isoform X1 [Herrania umbratica]|uniref:Pumilio homolog 23 isoform X1 n=2 Tax=Herrania umbratica TaxID=108875 RepID=A0A6J1B6N3_9ROSI|nr:pumilio homolog 23 isoform X1 [Herrania umbratica]XP_021295001.1 pumilio homolog 23 isoform X1 [Herrania umbratica]